MISLEKDNFSVAAWQSDSVHWQMCLMLIVVSVVTIGLFGPHSTCDLWMAQLIGVEEGKGIWFDSGTKFYDSNGFSDLNLP